MIRHRLLVSLVALAFLPTVAMTGAMAQNSGTEAEQEACTSDVFRLCQDYIPNEGPIVACLKVNRVKLSPACYKVFYSDATTASVPLKHKHKRRRHAE